MENKHDNKIKGSDGEESAARFLIENNFEIVVRNYTCVFGEVDIVARKGEVLHFVEVKSRTGDFIPGRFAVNKGKQTHIKRTAETFMSARKLTDKYFVSFDVVEITDGKIEFLQNCFY